MSNPSINRWGLNLFWYNFWFNDKISSLLLQQDLIINKFIYNYIQFGLLHIKNIFLNKYWYNMYKINYLMLNNDDNLKYFRIIQYKNKILNQDKSYKIRNQIKNTYFSKIWILRFQNWIIINIYSFQPLTSKNKTLFKRSKETNFFLNSNKIKNYKNNRIRFIYLYIYSKINKNSYYKF